MDGRTLLQIISKDEKAKQFWEKFLEWERDKGTKYGDKGNDHNFD